jgi:hypothetical protein
MPKISPGLLEITGVKETCLLIDFELEIILK